MPLEVNLTNEQKVRITCAPTTQAGNPAPIDGALTAELVSGDGSSEPGATPNEVVLLSGSTPGDVSFIIQADVDMDGDVQLIQDTVVLHVEGAMASSLGLVAGTPEVK